MEVVIPSDLHSIINQLRRKIMKEISIDTRNLIPAPLDDKNILVDSVMDSLFDGEDYTFDKNEYLGFVGGYPTYAEHHANFMKVRFVKPCNNIDDTSRWASEVVEHLTLGEHKEVLAEFDTVRCQYIDDSPDVCTPFIMSFVMYKNEITVMFHWNAKEGD